MWELTVVWKDSSRHDRTRTFDREHLEAAIKDLLDFSHVVQSFTVTALT